MRSVPNESITQTLALCRRLTQAHVTAITLSNDAYHELAAYVDAQQKLQHYIPNQVRCTLLGGELKYDGVLVKPVNAKGTPAR